MAFSISLYVVSFCAAAFPSLSSVDMATKLEIAGSPYVKSFPAICPALIVLITSILTGWFKDKINYYSMIPRTAKCCLFVGFVFDEFESLMIR